MGFRVTGLVLWMLIGFTVNATEVEVITPVLYEKPQSMVITGTIEGVQQASIASQQAGLVASIAVEAGDDVKKGQVLLTLDDTLAKLNLAQAKAGLKAAKVALAESERLYQEVVALSKQKVVAQTLISRRNADVAAARAVLNAQQASFAVVQEQLNRHTIYAPFDGLVAERMVNVGEWVAQSSGLFHLLDSHLRLRVGIAQQYFTALKDANNLNVTVNLNGTGSNINATINRVVKAIDTQSRTFTAFIDLPKSDFIVAGMSATATIAMPQGGKSVVWLPASAIKQHPDGGASIFTVENQKVKRMLVTVVDSKNGQIAVSGITEQLPIVASGIELLKSGAGVSVKSNTQVSKNK